MYTGKFSTSSYEQVEPHCFSTSTLPTFGARKFFREEGEALFIYTSEKMFTQHFSQDTGILWAGYRHFHFTGERVIWCWVTCPKLPRMARSSAWPWTWVLHPKPGSQWQQNSALCVRIIIVSPWALGRQLSLYPPFLQAKKVVKSWRRRGREKQGG